MDTTIKKNALLIVLGVLVLGVMGVNLSILLGLQGEMGKIENTVGLLTLVGPSNVANTTSTTTTATSTSNQSGQETDIEALFAEIVPRGVPDGYGEELKVTFEEPIEGLEITKMLDGDLYPQGKYKFEQLTETQKQRYIKIGQSISCEFCCGAKIIVAPDGKPACGCAHSAAMRGLTMHLLINNENDYTDEQILEELTKWKILFFPKQMLQKAIDLKATNGEISSSGLNQLPDMVGGC